MFLITALIVKNGDILVGIYVILIKNVLDQTWKASNVKFGPQKKDCGSNYQAKQILAFFRKLVARILG